MYKLAKHKYGCRVLQKVIQFAKPDQRIILLNEIKNENIVQLCKDQNANHVIQKCLEYLSYEECNFIIKRSIKHLGKLCLHQYGCRIIQKFLLIGSYKQQSAIIDHIIKSSENFDGLIVDQFGNYLIQDILDMSTKEVFIPEHQ